MLRKSRDVNSTPTKRFTVQDPVQLHAFAAFPVTHWSVTFVECDDEILDIEDRG